MINRTVCAEPAFSTEGLFTVIVCAALSTTGGTRADATSRGYLLFVICALFLGRFRVAGGALRVKLLKSHVQFSRVQIQECGIRFKSIERYPCPSEPTFRRVLESWAGTPADHGGAVMAYCALCAACCVPCTGDTLFDVMR